MQKKLSPQQEAEAATRYASGESSYSISRSFNVHVNTILSAVRAAGVTVRYIGGKTTPPKVSRSDEGSIVNDYLSGLPATTIGRKYDVDKSRIYLVLKRHGVVRRTRQEAKRTHSLNESVFDDPTPEARYWIGFLMADGCILPHVNRSPEIKLSLSYGDIAHVEAFRQFLGSSHTISVRPEKTRRCISGRYATINGVAAIAVSSSRLAAALATFGVVPRKSHTAKVSRLEQDLNFWRGVLEGDGCFGFAKTGASPYIHLCGSEPLMGQFAVFCKVITPQCKANITRKNKLFFFRTSGQHALAVIRTLYRSTSVGLQRKVAIAQSVLKEFAENQG